MKSEQFPAHLDLYNAENADELRMRCGLYENPRDYVESLVGKYKEHMLFRTFRMMGSLFGPSSEAANKHATFELKKAFLAGNLLGAEVVDVTGGQTLIDCVAAQDIEFPNISDELSSEQQLALAAQAIQLEGLERYNTASIFHPLLNRWGRKIAHRNHQESLRAGFGMILYVGATAIEHFERTALEAALESDIDWDKDMQQLLGGEG